MFQEPMMLMGLHGVEKATRKQFGDDYVEATKPTRATPTFNLWAWFRRPRTTASSPEARPHTAGVK